MFEIVFSVVPLWDNYFFFFPISITTYFKWCNKRKDVYRKINLKAPILNEQTKNPGRLAHISTMSGFE